MSAITLEKPFTAKRLAARPPRNLTLEKFLRWKPEDGYKYEWVNGIIEKTERSMTPEQQYIIHNLQRKFTQTAHYQEGGDLVVETDATLNGGEVRRPDVSLMTAQQRKECAFGKPFLPVFVVEIISKNDSANKIRRKLNTYFKNGVQVVWQIFPEFQTVDVYTSPTQVQVLEGDNICSASPAVPDFAMSVNDIFRI